MGDADVGSADVGARARGVFAHPADAHCVAYHLLVVASYGVAWWLWQHPAAAGIEGPYSRAAFVVAAALLLGWISGVDVGVNFHNHVHRRIFRSAFLNRWFGRVWPLFGGWPSWYWQYAHVVVHHRNVLGERDWTLPRPRPDGQFESYFAYCLLHWPLRYAAGFWRDLSHPRTSTFMRRRALLELGIFGVLWSLPFFYDPLMALWLWALPHYLGNALVMGPGMLAQHAGREAPAAHHTFRHSNTFTSKLFNLAMFNIGYHAEHHTFPHVHWSELPAFHAAHRDALVADGAHVVPFGYFRGGMLLSRAGVSAAARAEWEAQHPDYLPARAVQPHAPQERAAQPIRAQDAPA